MDTSQRAIAEAQQSANEETKSSAGDKYETGRSMMQLEIEKNSAQLNEALKLKRFLQEISLEENTSEVQRGSVVMTDQENFYIAIGAGALTVDGVRYVAVSPSSPIGMKMMGLKPGDQFQLNNRTFRLTAIA